jgi:hypothetical protein
MTYNDSRLVLAEKTCSGCQHWHKAPVDPHNLSAPAQGECRERLHSSLVRGPQGQGTAVYYPSTFHDFPACGQYRGRIEVTAD